MGSILRHIMPMDPGFLSGFWVRELKWGVMGYWRDKVVDPLESKHMFDKLGD